MHSALSSRPPQRNLHRQLEVMLMQVRFCLAVLQSRQLTLRSTWTAVSVAHRPLKMRAISQRPHVMISVGDGGQAAGIARLAGFGVTSRRFHGCWRILGGHM